MCHHWTCLIFGVPHYVSGTVLGSRTLVVSKTDKFSPRGPYILGKKGKQGKYGERWVRNSSVS